MILSEPDTLRNVNVIRYQLKLIIDKLTKEAMNEQANMLTTNEDYDQIFKILLEKSNGDRDHHISDDKRRKRINNYVDAHMTDREHFWPTKIRDINADLKKMYRGSGECDDYLLYLDNLKLLDLQTESLPFLSDFVLCLFAKVSHFYSI